MVDARVQILELLKSIDYKGLKVKMNFPKEKDTAPLITFFQITNTNTDIKVRDSLSFQIDVWTNTFESCIDLMTLANDKLVNLGLKRDYESPDADIVDASGLYRKTLRFSRNVDTRNGRLIN